MADSAADTAAAPSPPADLFGIGAALYADGDYPVVRRVVKGGAADREGHLKANDHVTGVAEGDAPFVDCKGMDLHKIIDMTRGKEGSIVRLQVIPAGADPSKKEVIRITRAELYINRLTPPQLARLEGDVGKFSDAVRKVLADEMQNKVAEVVQASGLNTSGSNALQAAAAQAAGQCVEKSKDAIADALQKDVLPYAPESRGEVFDRIESNPDAEATNLLALEKLSPEEMPAWQAALRQILTPAQAAAWDAHIAQQKQRQEDEMKGYLDHVVSYDVDMERQVLAPAIAAVREELKPSKDRDAKLVALENSIAADVGKAGREAAEKGLLEMSEVQRQNLINSGSIGFVPQFGTDKWDEGLAKLLSADELKRIQAAHQARIDRRAAANGQLLLVLMDEKIALTAAQRKQLEPIARRLVQSQPELISDRNPAFYYNFSRAQFFAAAESGSASEIEAILDPIQWGHWQATCKLKDSNSNEIFPIQLPSVKEASSDKPVPEPEEVDSAYSRFMSQKSSDERRDAVSERVLKAEDVARVVHLPPDTADRLKTAARGEADEYLVAWNQYAGDMVRGNLDDPSPETVQQQLDGIQQYQFLNIDSNITQNQPNGSKQRQSVWDRTVKAILTPDQLKAWKQETDAREAYRHAALSSFVVSTFDQTYGLSADQWAKLQALVEKIIDEYANELGVDQYPNTSGGFLDNNLILVPIAGIPANDLKALLSDDELKSWQGSYTCSNATQNWGQIQMMHKQAAANSK